MVKKNRLPRGLRNNNPLNIRGSKKFWLGQVGTDRGGFCIFADIRYGYRAAFRTLRTYAHKYHIKTVGRIIERWAPTCENETQSYINSVCIFSNFKPYSLVVTEQESIDLVRAMAKVECGIRFADYIKTEDIEWGYGAVYGMPNERRE